MPDITMCMGKNEHTTCPRHLRCFRYLATPTPLRQSYFMVLPISRDKQSSTTTCDYFWNVEESR